MELRQIGRSPRAAAADRTISNDFESIRRGIRTRLHGENAIESQSIGDFSSFERFSLSARPDSKTTRFGQVRSSFVSPSVVF